MRICVDCNGAARPRIGERGPHPKRCQDCHDRYHAARLDSVKQRVKNTPWKPRPCCICEREIPKTRSKRATTCSDECQRARIAQYQRSHYEANRESYRLADVERRYGLSAAQYAYLVEACGSRCTICREPQGDKLMAVDHDHDTGAVRGLLCQNCNVMIGMARENPQTLRRAADYLLSTTERHARENPA